ncbi:peptide-methionine (S)-S-oxide reductase [Arenibacter nanhaiticus]|uniref:peptide-methionine (S)-S-oxide reductase n=1 Tax=Arenibacter nanhaiticus TaxID=558155 RepID=A0A1M6E6C6_9FLAO|nr:peptide-methionine (S)-S-oxide reductase [Arenibacter nanhaiticus]SHI80953.1 peptide-methionine (S)-S-oxide reductase [Arenibacter nanhaiticus]
MGTISKIAFGGGCHWCTEAIFMSVNGVVGVDQGFISIDTGEDSFSEAVIVYYQADKIGLHVLISIHLYTHRSTSVHSMRKKYRSAIYTFNEADRKSAETSLEILQQQFSTPLITQVYPFKAFRFSDEMFHNYYYTDPNKPFCTSYIVPKLKVLFREFGLYANKERIGG